tara:strand:+ start:1028 stop:1558 length:531 start_codon:yes stop_codon:yes gene_type:complete
MSIKKPTNSFQYYLKHWKNLSNEEKKPFVDLEKRDKSRYAAEQREVNRKEAIETKKLKMYVITSGDRVSCVGLDNGFARYTVRGPVVKIVNFTEKELDNLKKNEWFNENEKWKKLKIKEVKLEDGGTFTFDKNRAKKYNIINYGYKGSLLENYEGYVGKYTEYNNYKGESWTDYGY